MMQSSEVSGREDQKTIVVVEDNEAVVELLIDALEIDAGYKVEIVLDGSRALEVIRSVPVSLILLDVKLPGKDGFQIYDALKADPSTAHIPVIFTPASHFDREFEARGITRPVFKPFDIDELLTAIDQTLNNKQARNST